MAAIAGAVETRCPCAVASWIATSMARSNPAGAQRVADAHSYTGVRNRHACQSGRVSEVRVDFRL
jgi:hypothetical protein